jgi:hypothetical protein
MDDGDYPITSLVDAAAAGDEHAWHEIVDRIGPTRGQALERLRQTFAVRDHLTGPARVPAVSDGAARLGRSAPRDLDRPRERRWA